MTTEALHTPPSCTVPSQAKPPPAFPPVTKLRWRLVAMAVDVFLLGLLGFLVVLPLVSGLMDAAPIDPETSGHLIGLAVVLAYFGLLNSRVGSGKTLGKRLVGIAVRDEQNHPIGTGRSLLRISILALPALFQNWSPAAIRHTALAWVPVAVYLGVGAALSFTLLFNWKGRQGFHDLVCRTYVVELSGGPPTQGFPQTARVYRVAAVGLVTLGVVVALALWLARQQIVSRVATNLQDSALSMADLERLMSDPAVRKALEADRPGGQSLTVCAETRISYRPDSPDNGLWTKRSLEAYRPGGLTLKVIITVEDRFDRNRSGGCVRTLRLAVKRFGSPRPGGDAAAIEALAGSVINRVAKIDSYRSLSFEVGAVCDIWIASRDVGVSNEASPAEWRRLVSKGQAADRLGWAERERRM